MVHVLIDYLQMSCTEAVWNLMNLHLLTATEILLLIMLVQATALVLSVVVVV